MSITKYEIGLMEHFLKQTKEISQDMTYISQHDVALPFTDSEEHDVQQTQDLFKLIEDAAHIKLANLRVSDDFSKGAPPHGTSFSDLDFNDGEFGFAVSAQRSQVEDLLALKIETGGLEKGTTLKEFIADKPAWANGLQIFLRKDDLETVKNTFRQKISDGPDI
ncbi:MAG: hypothetical protein COB36_08215 [Alphaproteobacteria bacterium]|nr:MAG: hypothetical protein COB36_08215 [Alphaproteobacteria bacterium]